MSDLPTVKKKDIPLAVLLLAAHVAVNYRRLIGIFTGLSSLGAGGVIGLMQYLENVVLALVPVAMLVLVAMFVFQGKAVAKALSALCAHGRWIPCEPQFGSYRNIVFLQMGFYELFPHFGDFGASLAFGLGMLQIGSKLRKSTLRPQFRSYGLTFYGLLSVVVIFVAIPAFMDMTVTLSVANLLSYALFMAAGFFMPATLLEDGKKSYPVNMNNLLVTIVLAAFIYLAGGTIGYSSYVDSHRMPGSTTVSCPVCHKKYTDNGNKRSIQRKNMCKSCSIGYKATKDALGG